MNASDEVLIGEVHFHREGVPFPLDRGALEGAAEGLESLIQKEKAIPGELNIIFCSDELLLHYHREYLGKEDHTDIITFDHVEGDWISGDLFISTDRIRENAELHGRPESEELHRVMAHGVLHLLGYKDGTAQAEKEMREQEEEALHYWGFRS